MEGQQRKYFSTNEIILAICNAVLLIVFLLLIIVLIVGCYPECIHGVCQYAICRCKEHFSGLRCQVGHPFNGGIWNESTGRADCPKDYCGELCEIPRPFQGGEWFSGRIGTKCPEGFGGVMCEIGFPLNGGVWNKRKRVAICPHRFSGILCQYGHPYHGGKWNVTTGKADCLEGFEGPLCETGIPLHGGTWNPTKNAAECPEGFTGILCETGIVLNGGRWYEDRVECPENFSGPKCEIGNALNGGFWDVNINKADCPREWKGQLCDIKSDCPQGIFRIKEHIYWFSYTNNSWEEARDLCKSEYSRLLVIENSEQMEIIDLIFRDFECERDYWTSGNDRHWEGEYLWESTGLPMTFRRWCAGQPDDHLYEDCVSYEANPDSCFNDDDCGKKFNFICEIVKKIR